MLRDRERDRRSAPQYPTTTTAKEPVSPGEHPLVCAVCGHRITDRDQRIEMSGAHEHTFVNPAGIVHHIGCFAAAPGCVGVGGIESAFSWFPGWTWQIAACGRCRAHLGWIYRNADERFHGLITTALREP